MSLRFRPRLESLERRETPSPIGGDVVDPNSPPAPPGTDPTVQDQPQPGQTDPTVPPTH
jgi:hypothetical protein